MTEIIINIYTKSTANSAVHRRW